MWQSSKCETEVSEVEVDSPEILKPEVLVLPRVDRNRVDFRTIKSSSINEIVSSQEETLEIEDIVHFKRMAQL
jgi:hypothetical protein